MFILPRRIVCGLALALALFATPLAHAQERGQAIDAASETKPVIVFAAASLKTALDRIATGWHDASGARVSISYAASSALAKQIESGAPADMFFSADLRWMDWLEERDLIAELSRKTLLGNALVLIAPKDSAIELKIAPGFELSEALGEGRLAIGEPNAVPAGTYAKAALEHLGVWDQLSTKFSGAENVRVALTYVSRGEAPLGIVYATDAKSDPGVKVIDTFPAASHPPIVYPVALMAASVNSEARAFLEHLSSPAATEVFESEGFTVLKGDLRPR